MFINENKIIKTNQQGFTLVEFMISMALSLAAILVVTSIYITSFKIDSKTIKYARLNDEVTSIMALLSEDIKRAGYIANAEVTIQSAVPAGNTSKCNPDSTICAPVEFRTLLVDQFAGEVANSCVLFAYDFNDNGAYDNTTDWREAFGYRLHDKKLETRKGGFSCTQTNWESLTDPNFVTISALTFKCKVSDDDDNDDYETDNLKDAAGNDVLDAAGNVIIDNIELNCAAGNLPSDGDGDGDGIIDGNGNITVEISFTATLVDDAAFSLTASEKVLVRNASYD